MEDEETGWFIESTGKDGEVLRWDDDKGKFVAEHLGSRFYSKEAADMEFRLIAPHHKAKVVELPIDDEPEEEEEEV